MGNASAAKARAERNRARLELYYEAEAAILGGAQSYAIGSRNLTRANLAEVRDAIDALERKVAEDEALLAGSGRRKSVGVYLRDW